MGTTTAARLKAIMNARGLRQSDVLRLAEPYCEKYKIKLNKSDLSQFVNGKVEPGQWKLTILGLALNVSEAWLMGLDVPMERTEVEETSSNTTDSLTMELQAAVSQLSPDQKRLLLAQLRLMNEQTSK